MPTNIIEENFLAPKFLANCLRFLSSRGNHSTDSLEIMSFFIYANMITIKPLYGSKVNSDFHPSEVYQMN